MEILHLKGVAFSRPETYKGGGGGAHFFGKGGLFGGFFLGVIKCLGGGGGGGGSSFMERGAIMEFFIEGGRHVFFLLVF